MENLNNYNSEDLQKCPYHSQQNSSNNNGERENANTGDWDDERDEAGTDPDRNDSDQLEEGGNNNSGGAGSTGSAATNS
ncbi:hypothetical protein [Flavobacterium sp. LAR06]|uniref:hypothetical protein n=1 Tax=Flavobacterium sp. LAR06 TaxID=3064897 RepID=UPI0035C0B1B9